MLLIDIDSNESRKRETMVISKATELGQALAESPQFKRFNEARDQADADKNAEQLIAQFQMKQMELQGKDELETAKIQKELQELQAQIESLPSMSELLIAQEEFQILMTQVNDVIGQFINPDAGQGCGGECSSDCNCDGSCH